MLTVHRAESGTVLVAALAELLSRPLPDAFAEEVVAVPARGIERWLAQQLSLVLGAGGSRDGVCARVAFPHPDELLDRAVAAVSPEHAAAAEAWQPDRAVWALLEVLDGCPEDADWCAGLLHHLALGGAGRSTRRFAVARRLTGLYAAAAAARPALLRSWAAGDDTGVPGDLRWQPELCRRLRERMGIPSPAELLEQTCARLRAEPGGDLPPRLSVYGPTRLDAARLQVLAALAEHREVHLWLHHPSPQLWERLRAAPAPLQRRLASQPARHPLLASMSRDLRELQLRLLSATELADLHHARSDEPPATLLTHLQADLRDDRLPTPRHVLAPDDRSVGVHACHGRTRQVEVLREVVLGLLADDPTLEPRDVLVLCPDVDAFAPLVAAAFGDEAHPAGRLRVALADRAPRQTNPLLGVAATLLALADGRVTASQVLDLAGAPPVRLRFDLDDDDLEQLRGWVVGTGVRWGLSAAHREDWRLAGVGGQGTWREGLDRLLTGLALGGSGLLGGVLPYDGVDSSDAALAGRLAELVDRLDTALSTLRGRQPVEAWLAALERALVALGDAPPDGAWQWVQLRRELAEVGEAAQGSAAALGLADIRVLLAPRLSGRPTSTSFRTGGLTVCTLTPMRSVPHRVVCLLGLSDGAFPRSAVPDGDDVLAREPQLGERDARSEDRQLLLDAVCAAQDHLVVTYGGADPRTGAPLPPAVPLGELLEALDATAVTPDGRPAGAAVVVRHPLQPFDARNFTAGALGRPGALSHDRAALAGARVASAARRPAPPFLERALAPQDEPVVELARLVAFWQHPAQAFLRQRLEVASRARDEEPDDALPVAPDALAQWRVGDRALRARLEGADVARVRATEAARGELPPGPLSGPLLRTIGGRVDALVAAGEPYRRHPAETVDVDLALPGGRQLVGAVPGVYGDTALTVTYSSLRARQRLRAWVELLALSAARPARAWTSVVVARDRDAARVWQLGPVAPDAARGTLLELVRLRDLGLRTPLPLPAETGEGFARRRVGGAFRAWTSTWDRDGEDRDDDNVLVWGRDTPLDVLRAWTAPERPGPDFPALVDAVWAPLLAAEQ